MLSPKNFQATCMFANKCSGGAVHLVLLADLSRAEKKEGDSPGSD